MPLEVTVDETPDATEIRLTGEVDVSGAPDLLDAAGGACSGGGPVVVDLAGVTFIDSSGLGALVALKKQCETSGGHLRVVEVPGRIEFVLTVAGLDDLLLG